MTDEEYLTMQYRIKLEGVLADQVNLATNTVRKELKRMEKRK